MPRLETAQLTTWSLLSGKSRWIVSIHFFLSTTQLADISINNSEETWPAKSTLIHLLKTLLELSNSHSASYPEPPPTHTHTHTQNGMFCHVVSKLGSPLKSLSALHCQFYPAQNIPPYFFQAHIILFCPLSALSLLTYFPYFYFPISSQPTFFVLCLFFFFYFAILSQGWYKLADGNKNDLNRVYLVLCRIKRQLSKTEVMMIMMSGCHWNSSGIARCYQDWALRDRSSPQTLNIPHLQKRDIFPLPK